MVIEKRRAALVEDGHPFIMVSSANDDGVKNMLHSRWTAVLVIIAAHSVIHSFSVVIRHGEARHRQIYSILNRIVEHNRETN